MEVIFIMSKPLWNIDESLIKLLLQAQRAVRHRVDRKLEEAGFDLSVPQAMILVFLKESSCCNQKELGDLVVCDKTSITRTIKMLEKRKLVKWKPNKNDRRQKLVYITRKGNELAVMLWRVIESAVTEVERGIDVKKRSTSKEVLKAIQLNLS